MYYCMNQSDTKYIVNVHLHFVNKNCNIIKQGMAFQTVLIYEIKYKVLA